jgi:hypothetical protein
MKNCQEFARLASEMQDRPIGPFQKLHVRIHLLMCVFCRRFAKQIELIHSLSRSAGRFDPRSPLAGGGILPEALSEAAKARIKRALSKRS